eukprot:TRINITY_DN47621_c0_g1_i1.p1 TRINITY_DN47621_c0_g1~~TRINITY_DN47621_c0_g1_i1.p1  ORF type:complete len:355 (+),score=50.62 TRINITY_DN47621_c0_g1_i1:86-1150(+)
MPGLPVCAQHEDNLPTFSKEIPQKGKRKLKEDGALQQAGCEVARTVGGASPASGLPSRRRINSKCSLAELWRKMKPSEPVGPSVEVPPVSCSSSTSICTELPAQVHAVEVQSNSDLQQACSMPEGAIDIYSDCLRAYRPSSIAVGLKVYALPLNRASENLRKNVEAVLHAAWEHDREAKQSISMLLGLQLNGISLRSGRRTARCVAPSAKSKGGHWLIWEDLFLGNSSSLVSCPEDRKAVGAMVLRRQQSKHGKRDGAVVIDYVSADRSCGGRGWTMVLAAQEICRQECVGLLYSAADLSQDGARGGLSAIQAHERWGFEAISLEDWKKAGLELYDESRCCVRYMRKVLTHESL